MEDGQRRRGENQFSCQAIEGQKFYSENDPEEAEIEAEKLTKHRL